MVRTTPNGSVRKGISAKDTVRTKTTTRKLKQSVNVQTALSPKTAKKIVSGTTKICAMPTADKTVKIENTTVDFYYSTKKFLRYFLISLVLSLISISLVSQILPDFKLVCVMSVALCALYTLSIFFGFIVQKQQMVRITDRGINIDNYPMLKWSDVRYITINTLRIMGLPKGPLIFFHTKNLRQYPLTYTQKMCIRNGFAAFSIPLYFLDDDQITSLKKELQKYTKFRNK